MPLRLPPLSSLRFFEAAGRHLSFKLAAAELNVTPSAVSHGIVGLEQALGIELFVREPRRLSLTPEGADYLPYVAEALSLIAIGTQRLPHHRGRRAITVSCAPTFASRWLLPRLARFAEAHPDIALHLHTSDAPVDLQGGDAQLAIRYGRGRAPGLHGEPLLPSRFAPVCAPALRMRGHGDLARVPLIGFDWFRREAATPDWPLWFARAGFAPLPCRLRFADEVHAIQAAIAGQGVALVNLALVADALDAGLLCQPFGPELPGHDFQLAWAEARDADPDLAVVRAWLLEEARRDTAPAP